MEAIIRDIINTTPCRTIDEDEKDMLIDCIQINLLRSEEFIKVVTQATADALNDYCEEKEFSGTIDNETALKIAEYATGLENQASADYWRISEYGNDAAKVEIIKDEEKGYEIFVSSTVRDNEYLVLEKPGATAKSLAQRILEIAHAELEKIKNVRNASTMQIVGGTAGKIAAVA